MNSIEDLPDDFIDEYLRPTEVTATKKGPVQPALFLCVDSS